MQIKELNSLLKNLDTKVAWKGEPNRREKIIFFVALFVFIFSFFKSCWGPSFKAIDEFKQELSVVREQNDYLKQVVSATSDTDKDTFRADSLKQVQYSGWAQRFASDPDSVIVSDLSNPNMLRDIKLGNIYLEETNSPGGLLKKGFKLSLIGAFTSIGGYLVKMENLPLLMNIDSIKIQSAGTGDDAGRGKVSVDLTGSVYGWK